MSICLAILLPIFGGVLLLSRHHMAQRSRFIYLEGLTLLTSLLVLVAILTWDGGVMTLYRFSGVFSIDLGVDSLSKLFAGMVAIMWPLVMLYASSYMEEEKWTNSFFAFYMMTYGVTLGVAFSASILTLYVFFEMLTLATIPLVSHYRNSDSYYAARSYAVYLIGGAALAFFPVVLITLSGSEGIFAFGGSMTGEVSGALLQVVYLFGFFGFGVKAAVFPLHQWLPRASVAPTPVTALLHAVAVVNSGAFAVARLVYYSLGTEQLKGTVAQELSVAVSIFTLVYAASLAVKERHFKKMLAYSTVSNLSYMLFGLSLMTPAGLVGGLSHMAFHGVIKMTLFLCAGAFMHQTERSYIYELEGVGKRMPATFLCYCLAGLSLVGIPLNCGFISKWKLMEAGMDAGTVLGSLGVFALILSAFLCALYVLVPAVWAFFPRKGRDLYAPEGEGGSVREAPALMLVPMIVFVVLNFVLGIWPGGLMGFLEKIAMGSL